MQPRPARISKHAIARYRERVIACCERAHADEDLRRAIDAQLRALPWRHTGGDTFTVPCGPLLPQRRNQHLMRVASVTHVFVIACGAVVTTLGYLMLPDERAAARARRRQRLLANGHHRAELRP